MLSPAQVTTLIGIAEEMIDAVGHFDWDKIDTLERQRQGIVNQAPVTPTPPPVSAEQADKLLQLNRRVLTLVRAHRDKLRAQGASIAVDSYKSIDNV